MDTFLVAQLLDPKLKFAKHILDGIRIVHNLLQDAGFIDAAGGESWKDCWLNKHMEFAFNLTGVGVEENSREFWAGKSFICQTKENKAQFCCILSVWARSKYELNETLTDDFGDPILCVSVRIACCFEIHAKQVRYGHFHWCFECNQNQDNSSFKRRHV